MESQYKGPERRKGLRAKTNFLVLYDIDPQLKVRLTIKRKIFNAIAKNLSEIGMAILTNIELPVDASANLNFTLYNSKEPDLARRVRQIAVDCRTCYSFPVPDGAYQVGLKFINLTAEDRRHIAKYVKDFGGKSRGEGEVRAQAKFVGVAAKRRQI
jgi:c-di-GMP-binding flagellar brake protein YcgR